MIASTASHEQFCPWARAESRHSLAGQRSARNTLTLNKELVGWSAWGQG